MPFGILAVRLFVLRVVQEPGHQETQRTPLPCEGRPLVVRCTQTVAMTLVAAKGVPVAMRIYMRRFGYDRALHTVKSVVAIPIPDLVGA